MNSSLPKNRITLIELLRIETPYYESLDGRRICFSKAELQELVDRLPKHLSTDLKLPFVFLRDRRLGEGVYSIQGGKTEAESFAILLNLNYTLPKDSDGRHFTYKPLIFEFMKRYGSLCTIGFI